MEMIKVASRLAKKLSKIKKSQLELLYEKDSKGRTTGYLIRKRNYGQFYDDYNDFIVSLNRAISKKYGIKLDDNNSLLFKLTEESNGFGTRIAGERVRNKVINHFLRIDSPSMIIT